ncbi:MAG: hypothetical protein U5J63_03050 [Fodinibius sp.]|nr:hypothetical protein [Fodinibius sp.]
MSDSDVQIDTSKHKRVPSVGERLTHAFLSLLFSFALVQLIAFWMFPGVGIGGLYIFSSAHSSVAIISDLTNVVMGAFMAICAVIGWFQGKHFTDQLKSYLEWWKFW